MRYLIPLLALAFAASPLVTSSFGGFDPNAFPVPQDDPPVVPAGYAFSIWGLIYLALIAHGLIGLRRGDDPDWAPTRAPLAVSLAVGAVWIPVANSSPVWATVLILIMLAGALVALLRAGPSDPWTLSTPIGLYAGWLTAASAVSLGLLLAGYGITSDLTAALVALTVALAIGLGILNARPSWGYVAPLTWAFTGVGIRNWDDAWILTALALIAAVGVILAGVVMTKARRVSGA
ncbi:hypothetical protein [Palleronia abyssalis]|uniref:Tryptophan-rich sensory protein n=1 Tax=Palleronia abyssalis TaxID=1501240 RepID=A0A2R8BUD4_9RHOB|nr:hypothetical protein [Palleronia abyssalis]SPJ23761.1 hypothetical protein PAA8504_01576 [Palleronia abyssalis]